MSMKQIRVIALNTLKETYRDKVYYSIFIFALFSVFLTYFLGQLTYRDEVKITMDLGLAVINLSSVMLSIFLGVGLVLKEIDRKSLYPIISRPMPRYRFLLGKFFGIAAVVLINFLAMGLIVVSNVLIMGGQVPVIFLQAIVLMFCEMLVMVAVAMFFSTFTTVSLASMFSVGFYFIVHSSSGFRLLMKKSEGIRLLGFRFADFIFPNFELLNLKSLVPLGESAGAKVFVAGISYAMLYLLLFLFLSIIIFSKKDFK